MANKPVICLGMSCVDVLIRNIRKKNTVDEDQIADNFSLALGGDALNQCRVLNRLGVPAKLVSTCGNDQFGDIMLNLCEEEKIDASYVQKVDKVPTSVSFVCIRKDSSRYFIVQESGSVNNFSYENVPEDLFEEEGGLLCVGSIGGSEKFTGEDYQKLFSKAHEKGYNIVADMVNNCGTEKRQEMLDALDGVDYLIPSRDEVLYYTGMEDLDKGAEVLHKAGVRHLVIKDGTRGSRIYEDGICTEIIPAYRVNAVDTTGAGDTFVGGFAAAVSRGYSIKEAVQFATAVSAISVQHYGAGTGIESEEQILTFISSQN